MDEEIFTENSLWNTMNSRVYSNVKKKYEIPRKRLCTNCQGHSGSVMISAGVSKFGKALIYFVKPGVKVN